MHTAVCQRYHDHGTERKIGGGTAMPDAGALPHLQARWHPLPKLGGPMPLLACPALETSCSVVAQLNPRAPPRRPGREGKGLSRRGRPLVWKRGPEGSNPSLVTRRRRPRWLSNV